MSAPEQVRAALEAIETAGDQATANIALQAALDLGASRADCRRAWRNRAAAGNYRQPHTVDERVTRCVTGKLRYPSRERAGKALNELLHYRAVRGQTATFEQRTYTCDRCAGWHLTSKPIASEDVA